MFTRAHGVVAQILIAGIVVFGLSLGLFTATRSEANTEWRLDPALGYSLRQQEQAHAVECLSEAGIYVSTPDGTDTEWISGLGLQSAQDQEALLGKTTDHWTWIETEDGSRFGASMGGCLGRARAAAYGSLSIWLTVNYLPQVGAMHAGGLEGWARDHGKDGTALSEAMAALGARTA